MDRTSCYGACAVSEVGSPVKSRSLTVRLILLAAGAALLGESWFRFRTAYALFHIYRQFYPLSISFSYVWPELFWGVLFLGAAVMCITRRGTVPRWSVFFTGVLAAYGVWLAVVFGRSMTSVAGALQGDEIALKFLSGVGFMAIGVLVLLAHALGTGAKPVE
jgi:hypothetical protein